MKTSNPGGSRQGGATLLVSLIMLVLITLMAFSAIKSGTLNMRIVGNMQMRDEANAAAQQAIEQFVTSYSNFYPSPPSGATSINIDINKDGSNDYVVSVAKPVCVRASAQVPARSADCSNGAKSGLICWDTQWEIVATATNAKSGVSQAVTQGVSITFDPAFIPSSVGC
jgi:Tfp pilus assembly protein PilX